MRRRVSAGERSLQLIVSHSLTHQLTHSRKGSLKNLSPQTRNFGVSPSISAARPVISSFTWLCGSLLGLLICLMPRGAFLRQNSLGFSPRSPAIVANIAFFSSPPGRRHLATYCYDIQMADKGLATWPHTFGHMSGQIVIYTVIWIAS